MTPTRAGRTSGRGTTHEPDRPTSRKVRKTEIVAEKRPQCGFGEAVRETRETGAKWPCFKTCPHCGYTEERKRGDRRCWKGYGVYVLQSETGVIRAGAFPGAIPEHKVPSLVARFLEMGASVRYVTRWNEASARLEVLLGSDR